MLCSMLGTPHFPRVKGGILFVEDVNEHPYRVERCLLQLQQAGVLGAQKALLLGAFTGWKQSPLDRGYTLKSVIAHLRAATRTPILTGLPFGHVRDQGQLAGRPAGRAGRAGARRVHRLVSMPPMRAHQARCRGCRSVACARGVQQQPLPGRAAATNTLFYFVRRALAALPRPDRVVLQPRVGLHLPDLRAALRLPLPEAPVRAGPEGGGRGGRSRATSTRTGSACPMTRRPSDRRERVRHPDPARASCTAAPGVRQGRARATACYHHA